MPLSQASSRNKLLSALSASDYRSMEPHLTRLALPLQLNLQNAGKVIEWIYFPEDGLGSIVATEESGKQVEVGVFGSEGMSGTAVVLGTDRAPHDVFMQIAGLSGLRISAVDLRDVMDRSPALHAVLLRYVQTFMIQSASSTAAAASYVIEQRLARWLLMCHDRIDGDLIVLTHEFMSMMLASRRAGVTVALKLLETRNLITTRRGSVLVLDRPGLETLSGGSYGVAEAEYKRVMKLPIRKA